MRLWSYICKKIQPVLSEGDQPWDFFGGNDAEAETPVLWPPHAKSWLIGKDSDAGRDLGQEEKGTTEDEMAGWHHWLDGRESEWTPGAGDGQGGLACWDSWDHKESDTTEWLNWTELILPQDSSNRPIFISGKGKKNDMSTLQSRLIFPYGKFMSFSWSISREEEISKWTILEYVLTLVILSSVQFSRSVVSDSLQLHVLQQARKLCPLKTPRVYPNSCPLS